MYPTLILNSRTPLTITLKGNETQFELAGVRVRDGPLENVWGRGQVQKKCSRKVKLNGKKFMHAN